MGRFFVKKDPAWGDDHGLMAVEQLPVLNVRRIDTGYVLLAGPKGEYLFEVDQEGVSRECVPWDDEMEREFQLYGEDIPPTYDMPEPVEPGPAEEPQPELAGPVGLVTQTDEKLYSSGPAPEQRFRPVAIEELGNEDPSENPYQRAARNASDIIRRDAEEARKREAEAAAVGARAENFYRQGGEQAREALRRDEEERREREAEAAAVEAHAKAQADKGAKK